MQTSKRTLLKAGGALFAVAAAGGLPLSAVAQTITQSNKKGKQNDEFNL